MGRKLYVGNLPYSAAEQDLQEFGEGTAVIGRCDGCGAPTSARGRSGRGSSLPSSYLVTDPPQRVDEALLALEVHLLPQAHDLNVDHVIQRSEAVRLLPYLALEHFAGDGLSLVAQQVFRWRPACCNAARN